MLQRIWLNSLCSSVICLIKARWLKDRAFFPDGINRKTKCKTVSVKKLKTLKKKKRVSSYRITSAIQTSVFFFRANKSYRIHPVTNLTPTQKPRIKYNSTSNSHAAINPKVYLATTDETPTTSTPSNNFLSIQARGSHCSRKESAEPRALEIPPLGVEA